jgi:hypothetical protein
MIQQLNHYVDKKEGEEKKNKNRKIYVEIMLLEATLHSQF